MKLKMTNLAADGLPYDENINLKGNEDEVEVIQFLRPNGRRRKMFCSIGNEYHQKAQNLIISAEWTSEGTVILYCRNKDDPVELEKIEIANNGPYPVENSPSEKLKQLIDLF